MKEDKLVSVIVPVYCVEKYLERCIDSILQQTYKNIEIILVDDGSKDNSLDICKYYEEQDSRVRVCHKENGGVSSARNRGIDMATGEYVCFIDPDDYIEKEYVEGLYNLIIKNDNNLSICNHSVIRNGGVISKCFIDEDVIDENTFLRIIDSKDYYGGYVWNKMYNLSLIKANKLYFDEDLHILEDYVFNCRYILLPQVKGANYTSKALYKYFIRSDSALNKIDFNDERTRTKKLTEFESIRVLMNLYSEAAPDLLYLIKLRFIKTTYKFYYLIKKSNADIQMINEELQLSKKYLKEIKSVLSFKQRLKVFVNIYFPNIYGFLGNLRRTE